MADFYSAAWSVFAPPLTLCLAIDDSFRDEGIEIPFPQQDVYVKQVGPNTQEVIGASPKTQNENEAS